MATIFKLIIEDDEGKTTVYPLADSEVAIGRRDGNTIRLMERNVSRRHARLSRLNGSVFIEDLDSYNGIRINGERITGKYEVKEGDLVEIGDYHLALQRTEMQDDAPPPSASQEKEGQWPQAGTVPDFRLPDEILQDVQHGPRDTLHDEPVAAMFGAPTVEQASGAEPMVRPPRGADDPMVRPPPRGNDDNQRDLPPFPTPGGAPLAKMPLNRPSEAPTERPAEKALAMGPARTSTVPRLVCVSTSYAGKEFALTRPELIIGRVEDNDIVIEHRSVSRNHAKILSNDGTHKIIDLQSANGILVNGEEYAMTDLRKGDLIELGHVRFRFTPANEAFVPTQEEADEMREAGVEPPSRDAPQEKASLEAPPMANASEAAPMAPYDPSQAATVTDTPLDALSMGQAFASPQVQSKTVPLSHKNGNGAVKKIPSEPPKRATEDQRPTELNRVTRQPSNPMHSAAALPKPRHDSVDPSTKQEQLYDPPPEAPKTRTPLLAVLGALVVIAIVLSVMLFNQRSERGSYDNEFSAYVNQEDWRAAVDYYEAHKDDFEQKKAAALLYQEALEKLGATKSPDTAAPEPIDDPEPIPEPVTNDEVEPTKAPPPKAAPPVQRVERPERTKKVRRAPRRAKRPDKNEAEQAFKKGTEALMFGKQTDAERFLKACLEADPGFARCHRQLGVLYAQIDDTKRSVKHYRRYVELQPDADDAPRVRAMIEAVESAQ